MALYDAPYISEEEHTLLDHTGVPGVQSGTYVAGTDWLYVESDYNDTQILVDGAAYAFTTMTFGNSIGAGDSFVVGTKGIHVITGTMVMGSFALDVYPSPIADVDVQVVVREMTGDGTGHVKMRSAHWIHIDAGHSPYLILPFNMVITEGNWVVVQAQVYGGNLSMDSFGGMFIHRIA